ncbi:MAG: glycosyltransferase family 39 protein [bacterium]|nr:glycosyltransferase family 39 protein [bacterium]
MKNGKRMNGVNIFQFVDEKIKRLWLHPKVISILWTIWLITRIGHLIAIYDTPITKILTIDAAHYHELAKQFAEKGWGNEAWFMNPGYPTFVGILYWLIDASPFVVMGIQTFLEGLALWLILKTARRLLTESATRVVMLLWVGYAIFPYYNGTLLTSTLIITLTAATLYFFLRAQEKQKLLDYFLSGIMIGATIVCRPIPLLLLLLLFITFLFKKQETKRFLKLLVIYSGAILIIFPFTLRNYLVSGQLILSQTSGGVVFWIGNNENANGLYYEAPFLTSAEPSREEEDFRVRASQLSHRELTSAEASWFWFKQALLWIVSNPSDFGILQAKKLLYWGNHIEAPNNITFYVVQGFSPFVKFLPIRWSVLMIFFFVGLWSVWKVRCKWIYPLLILLTYFLANQLFYSASEYRVAAVPVMFLLVASALQFLWRFLLKNQFNLWMIGIMALTPGFLWAHYTNSTIQSLKNIKMDYFNWAQTAYRMGMIYDAMQYYHQTLAIDPFFWEGHYQLAMALYELGFEEQAREEFARIGLTGPELILESNVPVPQDSTGKIDKVQLENLYKKMLKETVGQKRVPLLIGLGALYQEQNSIKQARSCLEEAYSLDSTKSEISVRLAQMDLLENKFQDALSKVEKVLEVQADNVLANLLKYHLLKQLKQEQQAEKQLALLQEYAKRDFQWQFLLKEKLHSNLGFEPGPELKQIVPDTIPYPTGNW